MSDLTGLSDFRQNLDTHLSARIELESFISEILVQLSLYPHSHTIHPSQYALILELNVLLTDYVANSQLVILPCVQDLQPSVLHEHNEHAIDNAVGMSYISNIVSEVPHLKSASSILLRLFADRLQMENEIFLKMRKGHTETVEVAAHARPQAGIMVGAHGQKGSSVSLHSRHR